MSQDEAVHEWLDGAQRSLRAARTLHDDHNDALALFHCHLAAEKALKALYILEHDGPAPHTHDLTLILSELKDEELKSRFEAFKTMSTFTVAARYDDIEILEEELTTERVDHWISFSDSLLHHAENRTR